ncbi:hypothetical protein FJV83_14280 [Mesorhizobium sp. WSM4307]|uniref:hypothetical protein n=1 Tax=unclassified Mesorhizobium TaxID=325217 RepID=UPI00115EFBFA|nr:MULTISPECIES: hypothetical protein [unclassified Mesorhizobium]TRC73459.1 hypothetical protein FJV81_24135 [Mesorhizobium sp. WSM4315]TRC84861.1 hypothetical protein FJV83_14280 [Mesorhizobium sp. WSM4307]TRC95347.1 hypothetical protein FJV82_28040 [Mesorhizobium sp. WSM4305]
MRVHGDFHLAEPYGYSPEALRVAGAISSSVIVMSWLNFLTVPDVHIAAFGSPEMNIVHKRTLSHLEHCSSEK